MYVFIFFLGANWLWKHNRKRFSFWFSNKKIHLLFCSSLSCCRPWESFGLLVSPLFSSQSVINSFTIISSPFLWPSCSWSFYLFYLDPRNLSALIQNIFIPDRYSRPLIPTSTYCIYFAPINNLHFPMSMYLFDPTLINLFILIYALPLLCVIIILFRVSNNHSVKSTKKL